MPKQERGPGRRRVFTQYLMTGDNMFKIVEQKHQENLEKEIKKAKEKVCTDNALAAFRKKERQIKAKKTLPKKIKANPQL